MSAISDADLAFVAREVKARTGLVITPDKAYLLESRLSPIARKEGFADLRELISAARAGRDPRLIEAVADALNTNETFFFRDNAPFDILRESVLPELSRKRGGRPLRIWCAACSSGQEPFSVAMLLAELRAEGRPVEAEIIATDVSARVLEKARAGLYSQFEVQRGLPIKLLIKYFERSGELWRLSDRIRSMVRFQTFNLLDPMTSLGRFDIVFCRNVLIYFDPDSRRRTLERIAANLAEDGALFLGGAETVVGVTDAFTPAPDQRRVFMRNPSWRSAA